MSKKVLISLFVTLLVVSSVRPVLATIWEDLEPEEVVDRAEVIVKGRYDFSTNPISNERIVPFCGMKFNVDKVYEGEVENKITAGIDCNDLALIEKFQEDGGSVLLFLEHGGKVGFSIPVAGPNGIVKMKNGEVQDEQEKRREFFTEFLEDKNKANPLLFYLVIFGIVIIVLLYYVKKKRRIE